MNRQHKHFHFHGIRAQLFLNLKFLFHFFSVIHRLCLLHVSIMANVERAFGVTNIKHHIPLVLDLDVFNYDAWRELFLAHCLAFDVLGHVDGTAMPTDDDDIQWKKRDGLVKLWIYGTLAPPLFKSSFKTGGSARDIWLRIENQFRNNKESRAIQLDTTFAPKRLVIKRFVSTHKV